MLHWRLKPRKTEGTIKSPKIILYKLIDKSVVLNNLTYITYIIIMRTSYIHYEAHIFPPVKMAKKRAPKPKAPQAKADEPETKPPANEEEDTDHSHCLICFDDLSKCRAVAPCGHNETCATCHLRLRFLHNDRKCPICKAINERIIVDEDRGKEEFKKYEEYEQWGDDIGTNYTYRSDVQMFFTKVFHENVVVPLFSMDCGIPDCHDHLFKNNKQPKKLYNHLRSKHGKFLCQLCVDHKRDFVSALPRMSAAELRKHESNGDGIESGFKGHPLCQFCKPKRFYDLMLLHDHLNKEHYKCHICEKDGKQNQFFKDYNSLNRHFDKEHFLCHDPQCLMARFVVFSSEIDLRAHEIDVHGVSNRDNRIKFEFRVRRTGFDGAGYEAQTAPSSDDFQYGLDGEVFVPEALPNQEQHIQENEPEITDPTHAARTAEIRREAAQIRALNSAEEAFPTLHSSATQNVSTTGTPGWAGGGRDALISGSRAGRRMNADDFPALGGRSSANHNQFGKTRSNWGSKPSQSTNSVGWRSSAPPLTSSSAPRQVATTRQQIPTATSRGNASSRSVGWGVGSMRAQSTNMSQDNFPSLSASPSPYAAAQSLAKKNKKAIVNGKKGPSSNAMSNVLSAPPPPTLTKLNDKEAKAKLDAMKLHLGQANYKKVKNLTKQFVADNMDPETYVLNTSAVFGGLTDTSFLDYMPALISSCPNEKQATKAMAYLQRHSSR